MFVNPKENNKERNYGIDMLRIFAVIMIVTLHCFTGGGLLEYSVKGTALYNMVYIMTIINYAGVDIFALISGYVAFYNEGKKYDFSKYIELWIQVVFYGVLLNAVFGMVKPEWNTLRNYISFLFPVTSGPYWYFCAYTGLYVMKPLLDKGLQNVKREFSGKLIVVLLLSFSLISLFSDVFTLSRGYTAFWIIILYIIGYLINKFKFFDNYSNRKLIILVLLLIILTFASIYLIPNKKVFFVNLNFDMLISYVSLLVVLIAICMVVLFARIRFKSRVGMVVSILSTTSFSIYLVDCHPMFWNLVVENAYVRYSTLGIVTILIKIFSFIIPFVSFVMIFDLFRIYLFNALKIYIFADNIEKLVGKFIDKIYRAL